MSQWKDVKLGDVLTFANGKKIEECDRSLSGKNKIYGSNGVIGYTDKYLVDGETIIIGRVGAFCGSLEYSNQPVWVTDNAIYAKAKEGYDSKFIFLLLSTLNLRQFAGGSAQPLLNQTILKNISVKIPQLQVQEEISSVIFSLTDKIQLNLQMNQTLEEMAMTLYKHWFVDFGPFQDGEFVESELGMIPKGWEVSNVGSVTNIFDSLRVPLSNKEREKRKGIYPYYGATSLMDYVDDYIFDGTYLLVGEDGSVMKEDGTPYTQYVSGKFWVNNHAHVLQGTNGVSTEWLKVFFDNCNVAPYVTGAVQPKINQKNLKSIPFLLPPQNVRQEFNKNIKNLYEKILINNKENVQLETIRNYLLPRLLSGEIDVSKAEKQVEEVL